MSDSKKGARIRAQAAEAIDAVVCHGRSIDAAIAKAEQKVAPGDRPLVRVLCYGTVRFYWRLSAQVDKFLSRPLKQRDSVVNMLLLMGVYQITDTRISDHAAVSLTAEAVRVLRRPKLVPLVNAVLRNFLRSDRAVPESDSEEVTYNHPSWMIRQLQSDWPEHWEQILSANNDRAPMWLRVNSRQVSAADYLGELAAAQEEDEGATGDLIAGLDQAVRLCQPCAVEDLPGFLEGRVSIQDGAAQIAAPWLVGEAGGRILDACAAPGGKTGHLLELAGPGATLTAVESDPKRVGLIDENLQRLGLNATVVTADASKEGSWWDGVPFERILLDAPCSASGVIRRHPDIKHLRRESDIDALARLQVELLTNLWLMLAPGGRLLYVTCSVFKKENDAVLAQFKRQQDNLSGSSLLPNNNIRDLMVQTSHGFQVLPGTRGLDGFYFACLDKTPGP